MLAFHTPSLKLDFQRYGEKHYQATQSMSCIEAMDFRSLKFSFDSYLKSFEIDVFSLNNNVFSPIADVFFSRIDI